MTKYYCKRDRRRYKYRDQAKICAGCRFPGCGLHVETEEEITYRLAQLMAKLKLSNTKAGEPR
jgi:hypothetical protein